MSKKIGILLVLLVTLGIGCQKEEQAKTAQDVLLQEKQEIKKAIESAAANDEDVDGLTDEEEVQHKTDKSLQDTDGDGLSDYDEVKRTMTDPLKADTDGDGKTDSYEVRRGQNPKAK